jgi:ABC-type multidrug transport system fused ATPase/permease subunit
VPDPPTDPPTDPPGRPAPGEPPALEVRGLSFRYAPDEPLVLDRLDLSIPAGGRLLLAGPSGAGKSTLVGLLARFWDYREGEIRLGGHDLRAYRADTVRSLIAVVPQQPFLFDTTVRENLYLAAPLADDAALEAACRLAGLHDFVAGLPEGYDTRVGENGALLSGGERQRLAIARAILKDAPLVVLDEPMTHLDALAEAALWQALDGWLAGRTTLVISHGRVPLSGLDAVVRLEDGRATA